MPKNILLVDTSFSAQPVYDYLMRTGYEVFVVGAKPDDALAKSVPNYINLDYSDTDELSKLIENLKIDFLVPGGNDLSYKVCSQINAEHPFYNIDSIEVNETINNKGKFRKFSSDCGLHVPRIIEYEKIRDSLPSIIKPIDKYSGLGVTAIRKADNKKIEHAVKIAKTSSESGKYIIEEFVEGQLHSHSAFISEGKIIIDFIVEEHCSANPFVVDTSRVLFNFNRSALEEIRKDISELVKKLNLAQGLIHTQFIYDGDRFWIIEITRRCPGDLYSLLIEFSTGFPYAEFYAKPFLNKKNTINNLRSKKLFVLRHTVTVSEERHFNFISFKESSKNLKFIPLSSSGDRLQKSPLSRVGILFAKADSEIELDELLKKCLEGNLYKID
jgi:carbamoylphosphate synthase large subunit